MLSGFDVWFAFIGLHLLENVRITSPGAVIFRTRGFGSPWTTHRPFLYPGNGRWGWTLDALWPWPSMTIVAADVPLAFGLEAVAPNPVSTTTQATQIRYSDIQSIHCDDEFLFLNGAKYVRCRSKGDAERCMEELDRLRSMPPARRVEEVRAFLNQAFQREVVDTRLEEFQHANRILGTLLTVLWLTCFVALPLTLATRRSDALLLPILAAIWLLAVCITAASMAAYGQIDSNKKRRFPWFTFKYAFYPVAALRASTDLSRRLFEPVHPVILSASVCAPEQHATVAAEMLNRYKYASLACKDSEATTVSTWFGDLVRELIQAYVAGENLKPPDNLIPNRLDSTCLAYCPRCQSQYVRTAGMCSDCPGVALRPFPSRS